MQQILRQKTFVALQNHCAARQKLQPYDKTVIAIFCGNDAITDKLLINP